MPEITFTDESGQLQSRWYDDTELSTRAEKLRGYARPSQPQRAELAAIEHHQRRYSRVRSLAQRQRGGAMTGTDPDSGYSRQAAFDQGRAQPPDPAEPWHPRSISQNPAALVRNVRYQLDDDYRRDILPARACSVLEAALTKTESGTAMRVAEYLAATGDRDYYSAFGKTLVDPARAMFTLSDAERAAMARAISSRAFEIGTPPTFSSGSYPVPYQVDPTVLLTSSGSINPMRGMARVEQIVGREWLGVTSGSVTVSRALELTPATDNTPTMAQPGVAATRVQAFVPFSMEVEQDWNGLLAEISMMLADGKDIEESTSFLTGNGTAPNAFGLLTGLIGGSQELTSAGTAVVTAADCFALEETVAPRFRAQRAWQGSVPFAVFARTTQRGALVNRALLEDLPGDRGEGFMGRPFSEHSGYGAIASNAHVACVGDYKQFMIVDRIGMSVELVPHLFNQASTVAGTPGYPLGERGVYAMWRNNSALLAPLAFAVLKVR